ncbi:MAG: arginyl-tRNA--protein-N-Asp/Glu arginylyltransferase [Arenicella sp.]
MEKIPLIYDQIDLQQVSRKELDSLLSSGWRHFGKQFFRYNLSIYEESVCRVFALRLNLSEYKHSKRFRKIVRKNSFFKTEIKPVEINQQKIDLFHQHKKKFTDNIPDSVYNFISPNPEIPISPYELNIFEDDKLIATSFFDISEKGISSIYGMFDLDYSENSLGLYTMLLEIEYAIKLGKQHYYHGYCYDVKSFYDYKKQFPALEWYDWREKWHPYLGSFVAE